MRLAPDPIRVDGARLPVRRPPPLLGEHTDEVLRQS
jgi:crotonobetainyl-CoA:carnitine CoA-transferase CaiB-like acyl-CoA transferase